MKSSRRMRFKQMVRRCREKQALFHKMIARTRRALYEMLSEAYPTTIGFQSDGALLAISVMDYKIPTLGLPEGINHVPVAIAGALILLFSIEHIVALVHGTEVEPAWH